MKRYIIVIGFLAFFLSSICLAKTSAKYLDFSGKKYNFYHYQITLIDDDLTLKKDNQLILTQPTLTKDIKNFTVNNIRKTENGFMIGANWGGGNYFYKTQFYFNYDKTKDDFYLIKIDECTLNDPFDEKKRFTTFTQQTITLPVSLTKFDFVKDYQQFYTTHSKPKLTKCHAF